MSQTTRQRTLEGVSRQIRESKLLWDRNNPATGGVTKPKPYPPTVRAYREDPDSMPYEIPLTGNEDAARTKHRTWYWLTHSFESFVCPDCDRPVSDLRGVEVHHIDRNPLNGAAENLIALCGYCHNHRHGEGGTRGRPLELWKEEFPADMGAGGCE